MTLTIRPIDRVSHPFFAGEVSGVDITQPLSCVDVAAISAGMDQYAALVFHDQHFSDEVQLAFSHNFGALEQATGDIAQRHERRARPFNNAEVRDMHRTTVACEMSTMDQAA